MINFLKKIKHVFNNTLIKILHNTSKLMPRNPNIWVFIGWHRHPKQGELFADNTKYLFLHVANNTKTVKPVWLAKSKIIAKKLRNAGYLSYYEKSFLGIWYALRSGKTVIDAFIQPINFRWSGGSIIVQLMHGRGMKKNAYSEPQPCIQDIITVTSSFTKSLLPISFTENSTILVTGYPRNDIFFRLIKNSEIDTDVFLNNTIIELKKNGAKIISYAPTFRRGQNYADIEQQLELKKVSEWLTEKNIYLVMSLHPKYRNQARTVTNDHILFVDDCDFYPTLPLFDLFINDYSSLFVDELLLDKPMVFFPYDLDHYSQTEGIAFDYHNMMPGIIAFTKDELLQAIEKSFESDPMRLKRAEIKKLYHQFTDGESSERIIQHIKNLF